VFARNITAPPPVSVNSWPTSPAPQGADLAVEVCRLREIIAPACEAVAAAANEPGRRNAPRCARSHRDSVEKQPHRTRFINLFANALEAMPGGGRISVMARQTDGSASIEVEDTGPGIPPDIRAELFEPFVQRGRTRRSWAGTGALTPDRA